MVRGLAAISLFRAFLQRVLCLHQMFGTCVLHMIHGGKAATRFVSERYCVRCKKELARWFESCVEARVMWWRCELCVSSHSISDISLVMFKNRQVQLLFT